MKHIRTDRRKVNIGIYTVVEDAENNIGIYKDFGQTHVTSRTDWRKTVKIAQLMDESHRLGYTQGYKQCMTDIQAVEEME